MHELEPLLGSKARLLGKGESSLLCQHADIAELLHMVKARLVAEPPELFQLKCPCHALEAATHLNRNNPSVPQI
jgi:hypothetical protein